MKRLRTFLLVFILLIVVIGSVFLLVAYIKPKGAGIFVDSSPTSIVFIDDVEVGRTPYKEIRNPADVVVKLVPESFNEPLPPYEEKISLVSGVETVVRRIISNDEDLSSGEVLSFEQLGGDSSGISIVTRPDAAQITINGATRSFSPYKNTSIDPGNHSVTISAIGYLDKTLEVKTYEGYQLTALISLSRDPNYENEEEDVIDDSEEKEQMILILDTPVGFLRAREEPSTLGEEVGQVEPGEKYPLLLTDESTGWFQIEFEDLEGDTVTGWVSNTYAKIDGEPEITPTTETE